MEQGTEWHDTDRDDLINLVIDEIYYPDTTPTFSCNDTFTALQTAISAEISYFAAPVVLTPTAGSYALLARYSYVDVPPITVARTFQIVRFPLLKLLIYFI